MPSLSNLYAEKIFSEHPTALWSLDDKLDYISLISETDRECSLWNISEGTKELSLDSLGQPFPNSKLLLVTGNDPVGDSEEVVLTSNDLVGFSELDLNLKTFTVSSYFYSDNPFITGITIGYEYNQEIDNSLIQRVKDIPVSISGKWMLVSETFITPSDNSDLRLVFKIRYSSGSVEPYKFYINGITLGQWSEEFNATSLGVSSTTFPVTINLPESSVYENSPVCLEASQYGSNVKNGYYLIQDNTLKSRNAGVPMVYGASSVTTLYSNEDLPSLIIPGYGFLNESGRYRDYTVEMWLRINSSTTSPFRIFGPINSLDGIYVEGPFITLVIGDTYKSHFINEWFRPMLVHIRVTDGSASLMINGEEVISFIIDNQSIDLPLEFVNDKSQDWLGFYCSEDVGPIEVDCVAIYNYKVPAIVAKRRFVYGQGVTTPEGVNQSYSGVTTFIDYPFANYSSNYSYPNSGSWQQGIVDNLDAGQVSLSTPDYSIPDLILEDTESQIDFYNANGLIQDDHKFITLSPNEDFLSKQACLAINKMNMLNTPVRALYGVFKNIDPISEEQVLVYIENKVSGDYFSISANDNKLYYKLKVGSTVSTISDTKEYEDNQVFSVGIDIKKFATHYGRSASLFFGNESQLSVYIGNNKNMENKFDGYIYRFGLSTERNFKEIEANFNDEGLLSETSDLISNISSYTLIPSVQYGKYYLDIGVSGYWEDYIPLSYFAKTVNNSAGQPTYDLDMLQFNVGFPVKSNFKAIEESSTWSYGSLRDEFSVPVQKTYNELDNFIYSGYDTYDDLANSRKINDYQYDTDNQPVKTYISFQYIREGANNQSEYFSINENLSKDGVVDASLYPNWRLSKFEVVDNTILYPPTSVNFENLAVVMHVEFKVAGIINKKIDIKKLELASQAFNDNSFNYVGTRFGTKLVPYSKSGIYYNYKTKNPFSIYKASTPYLYLTRTSGVQVRGKFDSLVNRGLSIPINDNKSIDYKVSAAQMAIRFDENVFPTTPTQIFEINYRNNLLKFYMVSIGSNNKRAKIYAINSKTGKVENGIAYYVNGSIVYEPVITSKSWTFLGFSFSAPLSFDRYSGSINLNGPMLFNNVSYYKSTNLQQSQSISIRPWLKVKQSGLTELDWDFWAQAYLWYGVLVFSEYYEYGVSPSDIYSSYIGNNKISIDSGDSLVIFQDSSFSYFGAVWEQKIVTAV
jgi:hypothetical protein